jgi:hypothetical protein
VLTNHHSTCNSVASLAWLHLGPRQRRNDGHWAEKRVLHNEITTKHYEAVDLSSLDLDRSILPEPSRKDPDRSVLKKKACSTKRFGSTWHEHYRFDVGDAVAAGVAGGSAWQPHGHLCDQSTIGLMKGSSRRSLHSGLRTGSRSKHLSRNSAPSHPRPDGHGGLPKHTR